MKRYIKVKGEWVDTKVEHDEWGRYYFIKSDIEVWYYSDEYGVYYYVGVLEGQTDER